MASAFFRGHAKGRIHMSILLKRIKFSNNAISSPWRISKQVNKNRGCIKRICFDKKEIWIQIPPGNKLVARDALLHTKDACCTLCCGRTAKPKTVDLWVWFPSMICLGWWAGTTGPPRIPPNQGCEHLSVMSFIPKSQKSKSATIQKGNVPNEDHKIIWKNEANFKEVLLVLKRK